MSKFLDNLAIIIKISGLMFLGGCIAAFVISCNVELWNWSPNDHHHFFWFVWGSIGTIAAWVWADQRLQ